MTPQRAAGALLVLGFAVFLIGALLFVGRGGLEDRPPQSGVNLAWERGLIASAVVLTALGFALLEGMLAARGDRVYARLGATAFLIGAVVLVIAEVGGLRRGEATYGLIVAYVILAFVGQSLLGVSVLRTDLLAGWIGWGAIGWSLGWLLLLVVASPGDVYFPVLHHVIPLAMGVSLLASEP